MNRDAVIEVALRPGFEDGEGRALLSDLREFGLEVESVDAAKLYRFEGEYAKGSLKRAAADLLADRVTEDWRLQGNGKKLRRGGRGWVLEVWLKPGVTDPVAESVERGLRGLRLPRPERLRVGQAFILRGALDKAALESAALKTVVNPVIHQWHLRRLSS